MNQKQRIVKGLYRVTDIMSARDLKGGVMAIDVGNTLEVIEVENSKLKIRVQGDIDEMFIINDIDGFAACTNLIHSKEAQDEEVKISADVFNKVNIGFHHHLEKYSKSSQIDDAAIGAITRFWAYSGYRDFLVDQFTNLTNVQAKNSNKQ